MPFIRIPKLFPEKLPGQAVLVDFYETENRINLGKIYFDPTIGSGYGSLSMGYYINKRVRIRSAYSLGILNMKDMIKALVSQRIKKLPSK